MTEQSEPKNQKIYDPNIGKRFGYFREKYIAKSQLQAFKETGIRQSAFSQIENGGKPVGHRIINKLVEKYGLNVEWLLTGEGDPVVKKVVHESAVGKALQKAIESNRELEVKVAAMERALLIMKKNQEFFINRIEEFMKQQSK